MTVEVKNFNTLWTADGMGTSIRTPSAPWSSPHLLRGDARIQSMQGPGTGFLCSAAFTRLSLAPLLLTHPCCSVGKEEMVMVEVEHTSVLRHKRIGEGWNLHTTPIQTSFDCTWIPPGSNSVCLIHTIVCKRKNPHFAVTVPSHAQSSRFFSILLVFSAIFLPFHQKCYPANKYIHTYIRAVLPGDA